MPNKSSWLLGTLRFAQPTVWQEQLAILEQQKELLNQPPLRLF